MKKLLLFATIILSACYANAQWTQCPLYGGFVFTIAVSDSFVYAGTLGGGGMFRSDNYGSDWSPVSNGLPSGPGYTNIYSIAVRGNEIFAGIENSGVYKSTDDGSTWSAINTGLPSNNFDVGAIMFVDSNIFILNNAMNWGIYKSSDSGYTWTQITNGLTDSIYSCIACDSVSIYAGSNNGKIFKSVDNGASWFPVNTGLPTTSFSVRTIVANDVGVYAGISLYSTGPNTQKIFKSTNGGTSWTLVYSLTPYISKLFACGDKVYLGTENGVYKSINGNYWTAINTGLTNKYITSFAVNGSDLFAGTWGGVFLLSDSSTTWVPKSNGINSFTFKAIENIGNSLFAGESNTGIYLTTDYGNTWVQKNNNNADMDILSMEADGLNVYYGTYHGVYESSDFGDTWSMIFSLSSPPYYAMESIVKYGSNIFIGSFHGIQRSLDNGQTWSFANNGLSSTDVRTMTINDNGYIFAGVNDVGVFMSTDNGNTWQNIGGFGYINSLAANDTVLMAGLGIYNPPVMTTNNYGVNWQIGNNGLHGHTVNSLKTIGDCVFAALADGVFYTKTNGVDWNDMSQGLPAASVNCIGRDDSCIYAGTAGYGIWKRPLLDFGIDLVEINITDFTANLNIFPNPATDLVYINCEEKAIVEIINMQGQIVATKTHADRNSSIDVSELRSGVYTLRVKTEKGIVTKKFVKQ